ncbi:MAG: GAF domain-containing protein [Syntrophobacteraceae bacterium]
MPGEHDTRAYMDALRESAQMLSGVLEEPEAIRILLQQITRFLHAQGAAVLLLNSQGGELIPSGSFGMEEACTGLCPLHVVDSELDCRVLSGETVVVKDFTGSLGVKDPLNVQCRCEAMIALPLLVRGHAIGTLRVYLREPLEKDSEDAALLTVLADLGALALEKVRLHRSLYHIAEALSSTQDLVAMLEGVLRAVVDEMWLKAASLRLLEKDGKTLRMIASHGLSDAYQGKGDVHLDRSVVDQRAFQGEVALLFDVGQEQGFEYPQAAVQEGIRSIMVAPVQLRGRPLGVLRVYSAMPRQFGSVAVSFLKSVAELVGIAIENAELYTALEEHNNNLKDELTDWRHFLALG